MKKSIRRLCLVLALWLLASGLLTAYAQSAGPKETVQEEYAVTAPTGTQSAETEPTQTEAGQTEAVETEAVEAEAVETEATESAQTEPTMPELRQTEAVLRQMPRFFQTDYPDDLFAEGTIATAGSSITSLAMVASFLTGHTYLPNELAKCFGPYSGSPMKRLEYASDELQLPWERGENWHVVRQAVKEGKVAIVVVGEMSNFTNSLHFLVITGVTSEGRYLINDPNKANYDHWLLREGFQNGFEEWQITKDYRGGWIYDPAAMPEDPFIYVAPDYSGIEPRYPDIELTKEEKQLLASVIWIEARGEPFDGQQAIAEVVFNRMSADNYPNKLKSILYADNQFPSLELLDKAEPSQTQYEAIERALHGPYILEKDVVFFATKALNKNVWGTIGGHTFCYQWNVSPKEETTEETSAEETETAEKNG